MTILADRIASRHILILVSVAEMAERGELIADLSQSVVRSCIKTMRLAGADPIDIFHFFGKAIREKVEKTSSDRRKYRHVLESAYEHMSLLLIHQEYLVR